MPAINMLSPAGLKESDVKAMNKKSPNKVDELENIAEDQENENSASGPDMSGQGTN